MSDDLSNVKLNKPWLVAVWPGMGHVAISAGFFLMSKLDMRLLAEFSARGLFDIEHIEVKHGLIRAARLPRSRFFVRRDPLERHDIIVFIGEAQPPAGKYAFCEKLIEFAKQLGVERVFTFAAMATQMHPEHASRVFVAATDDQCLDELQQFEVELLEEGHISGLNGVLLAAAAEHGVDGCTLLGEMPHIFAQLPFPKASLAVLEVFTRLAGIDLDFSELEEQSRAIEEQMGQVLARVEQALTQQGETPEEERFESAADEEPEPRLSPSDEQKVERLFEQAAQDRTRAYELKAELDRLGVFKEYEDRFLDLFRKPD
jgi:proteasome assembly chaperone (PAC2) family protein